MRDEYKAAKILCEKGEQNKTAVDSNLNDDDVMVGCCSWCSDAVGATE